MAGRAQGSDLGTYDRQVSYPTPLSSPRLSPKRPPFETAGLADVFPYYAGFGFDWAAQHLDRYSHGRNMVLDPWNGSGTTTLAAQSHGFPAVGVDLNPIANIAAQLRGSQADELKICPAPARTENRDVSLDPLSAWLSELAIKRVRDWTESFKEGDGQRSPLGLVATFRVVRKVTRSFEGSNPTWVRRAAGTNDAIDLEPEVLDRLILDEQQVLLDKFEEAPHPGIGAALVTGSSLALPVADSSIDLILTSPPYLTRIDYVVAYARELAVLGYDVDVDRSLRRAMMGTTLTRSRHWEDPTNIGPTAIKLLEDVTSHSSKASAGYYRKQLGQYLDDLTKSLDELGRASRDDAVMSLVVQDSYYKDIPVQLATICREETEARGWTCIEWDAFPVGKLLTKLNKSAKAYTKGEVSETVLTFKRCTPTE